MKKIFLTILTFLFLTPVYAEEKTFYETFPTFWKAISTKRIDYFEYDSENYYQVKEVAYDDFGRILKIGYAVITYLPDGKFDKVGMSKVKYNPDGTIKAMGPFGQVEYNKKGQIKKIGVRKFYYDNFGQLTSFCSPLDGCYVAHYAIIDNPGLDIFYEKMLADEFFNKYKNLKKCNYYENFKNIEEALKDTSAKAEAVKCAKNIDDFLYLYKTYLKYLNSDAKQEDLDEWFVKELKRTENWMKTHKVSYKNPYEEKFIKADIYIDPKVLAEMNKPEN